MPIYPQWKINPPSLPELLPWLVVVLIFYALWIKRATWGKHTLLGLGFFVLNLLPVLGFKLFSYMGFTWVFDHFIYIPMIGLIGLTIAALSQAESKLPASRRPILMIASTMAIVLLMLQSHAYAAIFFDQKTLWNYELIHNNEAWPAHDNIGNELFMEGDTADAEAHYQISLNLNPHRFEAHNNLGLILSLRGQYAAAIEEFTESLKIKSDYAQAHVNMADTLVKMGRTQEAIDHYKEAIQLDPNNAAARDHLSKLQVSP
jgi:tetratricopeptide (TPR) repeat protein